MLKDLRFPSLYLLEIILWPVLLAGFTFVIAFVFSHPIDSLELNGKSLPSHWEAAVQSNDRGFLPGYLISKHLFGFMLSVALVVCSAVAMAFLRRAQHAQMIGADRRTKNMHRVATGVVMASLLAMVYVIYAYLLIPAIPA